MKQEPRKRVPSAHEVMTQIDNAKTTADLAKIWYSGQLKEGRGRHDDYALMTAFLNKARTVTGKHWSDIVICGVSA